MTDTPECQAALVEMEKDRDHFFELSGKYLEQLSQAEAALREAQKDAERYRALREACALRDRGYEGGQWLEFPEWVWDIHMRRIPSQPKEAIIDAAIDAALAEKGDKGG